MPFTLQNEHLNMVSDDAMVENGEFLLEYVDQIHMVTDYIFKEIRSKIGSVSYCGELLWSIVTICH